jgi:molybdopterin-guanine dinucleotide biosynthesis protein A
MGRDKARLPVGSHLLVEEVAQTVASVAGNVTLLGPPERYRDLPFAAVSDLRPQVGPLGGLETALSSGKSDIHLLAPCDTPAISTPLLEDLLYIMETTGADCAVSRDVAGRVHPLCAAYRSRCLEPVRRALDAGQLRVFDLLGRLRTAYVDAPCVLVNLNRPEDWNAWRDQHSEKDLARP